MVVDGLNYSSTLGAFSGILSGEHHADFASRRLTEVFSSAKEILFDDTSRLVFFSDCHRGNDDCADTFAKNERTFLEALAYYYRRGFSYFEVGDGDELWQNRRFADVRDAHRPVFDLLHRFNQQGRLHLLVGNHDIQGSRDRQVEKDGIPARESLILRHRRSGQRIFVFHGHQADFKSDRLYWFSRLVVRHVWRPLLGLGLHRIAKHGATIRQQISEEAHACVQWFKSQQANLHDLINSRSQSQVEQKIIAWLEGNRYVTICGHTHRAMTSDYGELPYFNTGSCTMTGYITGLEIQGGEIRLVKWLTRTDGRRSERRVLSPARKLALLA